MAEAAITLGLLSASVTITLCSLINKFGSANKRVEQLSVHVSAARLASEKLASWVEDEKVDSVEVDDVKDELSAVLSACASLLSDLQDYVEATLMGAESLGIKSKAKVIWDEDKITETMQTLHHQEVGLLLILSTLNLTKKSDKVAKLREPGNVKTFGQGKKAVLFCHGTGWESPIDYPL